MQNTIHDPHPDQDRCECLHCGEIGKPGQYDVFENGEIAGMCDDCRELSETVPENLTKLPSARIRDLIRRQGTPAQIEQLDALEKEHGIETAPVSEYVAEYVQTLRQPATKAPVNIKRAAERFIDAKMNRNVNRPDQITFETTKKLFWFFLKEIVWREHTGDGEPKVIIADDMRDHLNNFIHWLIGSPGGDWPIEKSLYIWGDVAVGKSTIALAGHYVMAFYRNKLNWSRRYFDFVSMDEIFLQTYASQDLSKIDSLSRGAWCIDELREEHLIYKHFGNDLFLIHDVLMARHNLWKRDRLQTIITTNIPVSLLDDTFDDDRLISRINQQYHFVEFVGPDLRKL